MMRNVQNYVGKILAVSACTLLLGLPVNAQIPGQPGGQVNLYRNAETVTALMRGVCSSVEYGIHHDNSKKAQIKRALISGIRVAHDALAITNHKNDFQGYYLEGLGAVDAAQGLVRIAQLVRVLVQGDKNNNTTDQEDFLSLPEGLPIRSDVEIEPAKQFEIVRKYLLPALESAAALYLATADDASLENKKMRFGAQALLANIQALQIALDQEYPATKVAAGSVAIGVLAHSLYQLCAKDSGLNAWIQQQVVASNQVVPNQVQNQVPNQAPNQPQNAQPNQAPNQQPDPIAPVHHDVALAAGGLIVGGLAPERRCPMCLLGWEEAHDDGEIHDIAILPCRHASCQECFQANLRVRAEVNQQIQNAVYNPNAAYEDQHGNPLPQQCFACNAAFALPQVQRVAVANIARA